MWKLLLIPLLIVMLLSFYIKFRADIKIIFIKDIKNAELSGGASPKTYAKLIVTNDRDLHEQALANAPKCKANDKECIIYYNYRYLIDNFVYIEDYAVNTISGVSITADKKSGDCEDLSILLASLFENTGVKTYLAVQKDHVYVYACNMSKDRLYKYVKEHPQFSKYDFRPEHIEEIIINGSNCIAFDPSDRSNLIYPGKEYNEPVIEYLEPGR